MPPSVLFVCLGNICRSPLAEGVFRHLVEKAGIEVEIDSAGTGDWHTGHAPDERAQAVATKNGIDICHLRARQVAPEDFVRFDYIVAMDASNLANLEAMRPEGAGAEVGRLLDYAAEADMPDVPDPYYGGPEGFDETYRLVAAGAQGLLDHIRNQFSGWRSTIV